MARGNGRGRGRGRGKAEDVTGAKENKAEVRKAAVNTPLIKGERLLHHINTIKGYNEKISNLQGHRSNAYATMKAEGIQPGVVKDLIALEKGDPLDYKTYLEQMGIGLQATGQMFQLTIHDAAFGSPVEQAIAEGRDDAKNGRAPAGKYPENSEEAKAYRNSYFSGQADLVPGADKLTQAEKDAAVAGSA